jgi:hypothetical protein
LPGTSGPDGMLGLSGPKVRERMYE